MVVEDAQQYLDEVYAQFNQQPIIYNALLEIMEKFRTGT